MMDLTNNNGIYPYKNTLGSTWEKIESGVMPMTVGKTIYVNKDNTTGDGTTWAKACPDLTTALAKANDDDTIILAHGSLNEGAVLNITQDNLTIIAAMSDNNTNVASIVNSTTEHHLMTINANNVKIIGVGFTQVKDTYDAVQIATTAAAYKTVFIGCRFDGYGQGEHAIYVGATYDAPDLTVRDCKFMSWQTAAMNVNATRCLIDGCDIDVVTAKSGIIHVPTTSSRPYTRISNNYFSSIDGTNAVGITVSGTPTAGYLKILDNKFINFADDDHCISKRTGYTSLNYLGVTAIPIT